MRIAFAGFQHETNTFAPGEAGLAEFRMADSWPPLVTGEEAAEALSGANIPMAGALAAARAEGMETVPILWCSAEPSGPVTDEAFETISSMILEGIAAAGPLDGLCLDLHGAMVTQSHNDGEAALLRFIRDQVGPDLPVTVSLDLHANISVDLMRRADQIAVFRTYPHLDMAATGERSLCALLRVIARGRQACAFRQAPFLAPLPAQCTDLEPCRSLYSLAVDDGDRALEIAMGFTAADIPDCGPSILAYAATQAEADEMADAALAEFVAEEARFDAQLLSPAEAARRAVEAVAEKPVILADVQDNPGAGGASDSTGVLRALVDARAKGALMGVFCDPPLAEAAHAAGTGVRISGALGGRSGVPGDAPFRGVFRVLALSDGRIPFTGEVCAGAVAEIGPSALIQVEDVDADIKLVVSSVRCQCLDAALFTAFGAAPEAHRIVSVKSTVHYRADFAPMASEILHVAAPGAFPCAPELTPYRFLREGLRLSPLGPAFHKDSASERL